MMVCFIECDLKKQSQFVPAEMGAKSFVEGYYGNKPACGVEENKANSKPIARLWPEIRRIGWEK
jgi:hypothetical protein